MIDTLTKHRRTLHQIPEINDELPLTLKYIEENLTSLNCKLIYPSKSAVCAYFDFNREKTIAFRADMDALPIEEKNICEYKSKHQGAMHACGHDGHMAMLLTFANELNKIEETLPYNVMLIFQPAEEGSGGAKLICESGIFEEYNIISTYGAHVWPDLPKGVIGARSGGMMAKASEVEININGLSAHIAKASQGKDAMVAAAKFLLSVYEMEKNEISEDVFRLLKFGKMTSGTAGNAISAHTYFKGSMRAFDMPTFNFLKKRVYEISAEIEAESGCEFEIKIAEGYPPVINDAVLFNKVYEKLSQDIFILKEPSMTAEDFSFYGEKAPSFFFFLGTGGGTVLHADTFDFDEAILENGVKFFKKLLYI